MTRVALLSSLLLVVASCGPGIVALTERPQLHYEEQVHLVARVSRAETVGNVVLLELASADERRILARVAVEDAPSVGEWVEVRGVFVAELRVGDRTVYDAISVERVKKHRAPWFPYLL